MLSRGKVTPASVSYYSDEVAGGLEDYYAGRGEADGCWVGSGSAHEHLEGTVSADELARLFDGRHPRTGELLGAAYKVDASRDRVTGWDLTFSAPKSVSTLWAVGGGEIGMAVRDAHDAAVHAALAYLEEHATFSRTGKAGVRQVDTRGLLAAAFVHRTSRAGDPQLHTHVLVSGRVRCDDGIWRALDSRALHKQLKPAGMVYQAALRAELSHRLGVAWGEPNRHGQAEIVNVPAALAQLFSTRRRDVVDAATSKIATLEAELGRELTPVERRRAFQTAVLATRTAKTHAIEDNVGLHDRWRAEAVERDLDPERWLPTLGRVHHRRTRPVEDVVDAIVDQLEAERSTWSRAEVVKAAAVSCPTRAGSAEEARAWIEHTTQLVLASPRVVALTAPALVETPRELRRRDGQSVFDRHDALRFTTLDTLAVEHHLLDLADAGRATTTALVDGNAVDRAVSAHGLSAGQAAVVHAVTGSGDAVSVIVGPAGAGKSRALRAAAAAWTSSGYPVRGMAPSAVAAGVLADEAAIAADTVAKFLHDHTQGLTRLERGEVVIVDEATMISTRDLAQLLDLAADAGSKVVLVGDPAQLGAVDAGGALALLAETHAVELEGVHRFAHAWERDASLRLRARDPRALDAYDTHGRITATDNLAAVDLAARAWIDARDRGEAFVVTAAQRTTVSEICDTIRARRVARGDVETGGIDLSDGQIVGIGDEIVTLRNNRAIATSTGGWVRNGDRWTITARHADGSLTVSSLTGHGNAVLGREYTAEHVALAYALTVHKAQGITVDRGLTIVDDATTSEHLYVGMTRGRHSNTAVAVVDTVDGDHPQPARAARDVLEQALGRTSSDRAATHALREELARTESLAVLAPRAANLRAQLERDTPDNPESELARLHARRDWLVRITRPHSLRRTERDRRSQLRDLDVEIAGLEAKAAEREQWLDNQPLFAYLHDLDRQIADRRNALGQVALHARPAHLIDALGDIPTSAHGRQIWALQAARIEAYREEWNILAGDLARRPHDFTQANAWELATIGTELDPSTAMLRARVEQGRTLDHGVDLGR